MEYLQIKLEINVNGKDFMMKNHLFYKLRTSGGVGVVLDYRNQKIRKKLDNKGKVHYFVGYYLSHAGDTYRMYNPKTGGITTMRDDENNETYEDDKENEDDETEKRKKIKMTKLWKMKMILKNNQIIEESSEV